MWQGSLSLQWQPRKEDPGLCLRPQRTEHLQDFPGDDTGQGRETWRGQCRAGEKEEGAVSWSSLARSLSWLPLHQTEVPVAVVRKLGGLLEWEPSTLVGVPLSI